MGTDIVSTGSTTSTGSRSSRALGLIGAGSLLAATAGTAGLGALLATATPAGAATFTVANLNDSGDGSLRKAIEDANANPGADTITFAPGLSGTITLTTEEIVISDDLTITGPGSAALAVSGNDQSQIFYIYNATAPALSATISGLTLTHGRDWIHGTHTGAFGGGAIVAWSADLTLRDVVITDSTTVGGKGGAILHGYAYSHMNRNAHFTMENCVISGNSAVADAGSGVGFSGSGGGLVLYLTGSADISDTVIENNTSDGVVGGGGVFVDSLTGEVNLTRTRLSGNTATSGAAIRAQRQDVAGTMAFDAVSAVGNTSSGQGAAAVSFDHNAGITGILSSTIADNTGGGIWGMDATMLSLLHTTVAGNTGVGVVSLNRGVNIDSSLLADNVGGDLGSDADVNWSLVEVSGAHIVAGGNNVTGTDPGLLPLLKASNTAWIRPFANTSAAFNAGDPAFIPPPTMDQTGNPRVALGRIDMGAFELQPATDPTTTTSSSGQVTPNFTG